MLVAVMLVVTASAAFAKPPIQTGSGSQGKGAEVVHCGPFFEPLGFFGAKGNQVFNPGSTLIRGSECFNLPED